MEQQYSMGYLMGIGKGKNDASMLLSPYPNTDGAEDYQKEYKNGYFMGYITGIVEKIKNDTNKQLEQILENKLDEVLQVMVMESKQK